MKKTMHVLLFFRQQLLAEACCMLTQARQEWHARWALEDRPPAPEDAAGLEQGEAQV